MQDNSENQCAEYDMKVEMMCPAAAQNLQHTMVTETSNEYLNISNN